jgi:transposase InsO family protein
MRNLPTNLAQGQAGVYAVAAQLLLRGVNPAFPAVDIGADIVTDKGVKVQVKSARLRIQGRMYGGQGAYWFKLNTRAIVRQKKIIEVAHRIFSEESDFVVLWGINTNRFWVVPSHILDDHTLCVVGPESAFIESDIEAVKQARDQDIPYRTIASQLNLSLTTVYAIAQGNRTKASLHSRVREYEDRWDLVVSYPGEPASLCRPAVSEFEPLPSERKSEN